MVASLANEIGDRSSMADLKKEARSLSKLINNFKYSKINRSANVVAHMIAKLVSIIDQMVSLLTMFRPAW